MRILYAEDEKRLRENTVARLEKDGYGVDAAADGAEAMSYIEACDYDVVILDIIMPTMDGMEVLKKMRDEGKHMPVIMLTALSSVSDRIDGLDAGADDYLP